MVSLKGFHPNLYYIAGSMIQSNPKKCFFQFGHTFCTFMANDQIIPRRFLHHIPYTILILQFEKFQLLFRSPNTISINIYSLPSAAPNYILHITI